MAEPSPPAEGAAAPPGLGGAIAESLGRLLGARCRVVGGSSVRCYYSGARVSVEIPGTVAGAEGRAAALLEGGLADLVLEARPAGGHPGEPLLDVRLGTPGGRWVELGRVGPEALASAVRGAVEDILSESDVGRELERVRKVVEEFVEALARGGVPGALGGPGDQATEVGVGLTRAVLALFLSAVLYERSRERLGFPPLDHYVGSLGPVRGLGRALEELLAARREPLVELAAEVLGALPPDLEGPTRNLVAAAAEVAGRPHLLLRDVAGRIYNRVLGDIAVRKGLATFYTEVPAAYMLADLALRTVLDASGGPSDVAEVVSRLRIADFACGSGTLLAAALYCASRVAKTACFLSGDECPEVESALVERGLYGLETMEYAAAVARVSLALMPPSMVAGVNVYVVPLGRTPRGRVSLGSLELLEAAGDTVRVETAAGQVEIPASYDVVIMNPPFTRPTGRTRRKFGGRERGFFGFVADRRVRRDLLARYREVRERARGDLLEIARRLLSSEPAASRALGPLRSPGTARSYGVGQYFSVGQAGEGLLFLYLASRYVRPGGVVAFVLPRNLLSGVSWFLARALLAEGFHLRYVVVSSDSRGGYNFSENTSLSECLIVARRVDEHYPDEETVFVDLLRKPATVLASLALSEALASGAAEAPGWAERVVRRVRRRELLESLDNLNRFVALPEPSVVDLGLRLLRTGDLGIAGARVPLTRLGDLVASIGVDSPQFHESFRPTRARTPYPIVFGGGERLRSRMLAAPNAYAELRKPEAAEVYGRFSGRVLIPDRIWLDTAHVVSMYSETPVVSNVFYVARLRRASGELEKALVYWLNTTWGLLSVLMNREETRGRWVRLKKAQWRLLPVPDFGELGAGFVRSLAELFDELSRLKPRRVPDQYSEDPQGVDPLRLRIDLGLLRALDPGVDLAEAERRLLRIYGRVAVALRRWVGRPGPSRS